MYFFHSIIKGDYRPIAILVFALSFYTLFSWVTDYMEFGVYGRENYWMHFSLNCGLAVIGVILALVGWIKAQKNLIVIAFLASLIPIALDFAMYFEK